MRNGPLIAALLAAAGLAGCGRKPPPPPESPGAVRVAATLFPLADLVRQVGGSKVHVDCLLDSGANPHDYQAKPSHTEAVSKANLLVMVGLGIDEWARRAARGSRARVVELSADPDFLKTYNTFLATYAGAPPEGHATAPASGPGEGPGPEAPRPAPPTRRSEDGEDGHGHHHDGDRDPHVWLDPVFMQSFTVVIVGELVRLDPDNAQQYRLNGQAYLQELQKLDDEYRSALGRLEHRHFATYHPAYQYVARRYGLRAFALDAAGLGAISPQRLEQFQAFLRDHQVKAVFVEPQFRSEGIESLAARVGARVGRLDGLGGPDRPGYDSYLALMRSNLRALTVGLGD